MDKATRNLENDHVHILQLIAVMEEMVRLPEANTEHLEEIVNLIRNFADGLHHAKEENLLFPLMAEKGFSMQQGPIGVMMMEHEEGRKFVRGMAENIDRLKNGDHSALSHVYTNMTGYAILLANHIGKEDNILFRMADNVLTTEDNQSILGLFRDIDSGADSNITSQEYIHRIQNIANQYIKSNKHFSFTKKTTV